MKTSRALGIALFGLGIVICLVGLAFNGVTTLATQNLGAVSATPKQMSVGVPDLLVLTGSVFSLIGLYVYASTR